MNTTNEKSSNRLYVLIGIVAAVTLLFFNAWTPGLNWFILAIAIAVVPYVLKSQAEYKSYYLASAAMIVAGFSVFYHHNGLSIVSALFGLWFMAAKIAWKRIDPFFGVLLSVCNTLLSPITVFIRFFQNIGKKTTGAKTVITYTLIPVILVIIFGTLYYHSSPSFKGIINQFDWQEFPEFVFTIIVGLLIATVLLYPLFPQLFEFNFDKRSESWAETMGGKNMAKSWNIGIWTLVGLLIVVVISDLYYKFQGELPPEVTYSEYLHQGVFSLIVSVVLAAVISILTSNYLTSGSSKIAGYTFIGLNAIYVIQTIGRNMNYVSAYGLTEKRVIIFFYLAMCIVGLGITAYTMARNKNLGFLYHTVVHSLLYVLIASSVFDWSSTITKYNINHPYGSQQQIDFEYLFRLDESNTTVLYEHRHLMTEDERNQLSYRVDYILKRHRDPDFRTFQLGESMTVKRLNEIYVAE